MEVLDIESDHHQDPSKATPQEPQPSSPPKTTGKTDFHFSNIKFVWKVYERLKRSNASASVLHQCIKDNDFHTKDSLVRSYPQFSSRTDHDQASITPKETTSKKGKEKV